MNDIKKDAIKQYRESQLNDPIPRVERVSSLEIYLLDPSTEKRVKRICGVQKKDMPEGYVCLNDAGKGTDHKGIGYCEIHDQREVGHRVTMWKKIREENPQICKTIGEALDIVDKLENDDLTNINENLKLLNALLIKHLGGDFVWSTFESQHAISIIKEITKTIEAKNRIESQLYLDPKKLESFIHQIFVIIKRKVAAENVAHDILAAILNEVVMPLDQQKLKKPDSAMKLMSKYGNVKETEFREEREE